MAEDSFDTYINDRGDHELDASGHLRRDATAATRCHFRLMCKRGEYWLDPNMGSRFHTIKTLKDAQRKCEDYAQEALKPLIDEGVILSVTVGTVEQDQYTGMLFVPIEIELPNNKRIALGNYQLGG